MANFDRKSLRKIFESAEIEVPKDVLGQICDLHTSSNEDLTENVKTLRADLEKAERERDEFKAKAPKDGVETVTKEEYDKLKAEYDDYKGDIQAKATKTAKEHAFREVLKAQNVANDWIDTIIQASSADIDGIELDKDGKISNTDKIAEGVKTKWAKCIETTTVKGAKFENPPNNGGNSKMTKADIYKKDENGRYVLSTEERQKALVENQIQ